MACLSFRRCESKAREQSNRRSDAYDDIDCVHTAPGLVRRVPVLVASLGDTIAHRYNIEILPFSIRAKGYTVFSFAVTLSLIFNQCVPKHSTVAFSDHFNSFRYVNPIALQA